LSWFTLTSDEILKFTNHHHMTQARLHDARSPTHDSRNQGNIMQSHDSILSQCRQHTSSDHPKRKEKIPPKGLAIRIARNLHCPFGGRGKEEPTSKNTKILQEMERGKW
jgi:hypothetical protein